MSQNVTHDFILQAENTSKSLKWTANMIDVSIVDCLDNDTKFMYCIKQYSEAGAKIIDEFIKKEKSTTITSAKDRVKQEKSELEEKLSKLKRFIDESEKFLILTSKEQKLLLKQYKVMSEYINILSDRLKIWKD